MPIPLIIGLAAAAVTGVVGHCAKEVAQDYEDELNSINWDMSNMQSETNNIIKHSKETFEDSINVLYNQRKNIYDVTLTNFSDSFSKIKNVDFDRNFDFKDDISRFKQSLVGYYNNSSHSSEFWTNPATSLATSVLLGSVGGGLMFVGGFIKSMKLSYQIDDAKAEQAKLRAECEAAKKECLKLDSLSEYCKRAYSSIDVLRNLTDRAVTQVENIIVESGTDYSKYTRIEKQEMRTACNFAMALNDIVNTKIFNDEGEINFQLKKYVDGIYELAAIEGR